MCFCVLKSILCLELFVLSYEKKKKKLCMKYAQPNIYRLSD
jgi:hypothetical protein